MSTKPKVDLYQDITDRVIKALESGKIPWSKPWGSSVMCPKNLISLKPYQGINVLLTSLSGFVSPYWLTYKQAESLGANVKKGEKGTKIVYWSKALKDKGTDDEKAFMFMKTFAVFNVDQIENLKLDRKFLYPTAELQDFKPIEKCESIVKAWTNKPSIDHAGGKAFYSPGTDSVTMPKPELFKSPEGYYEVLFHELGHSTGHESRLNRDGVVDRHNFGSHEYSKEELVAEMTSAFLCATAGINDEKIFENSVAYIQSWLGVLKQDSKMVVKAAAAAQKASNMILNVKVGDA